MPITPKEIERETSKDDELRDLCITLQTGKISMDPELLNKFVLHNGIVFNGVQVVIPKSLKQEVLRELNVGHCGITRMGALTYSFKLEHLKKRVKTSIYQPF
jgi:hypothetical protein